MITNDQLLKLFVLVPSTVENFNGAAVSGAANEHRIFFEQSTGLLWAKGLSFGGNDSELTAKVNALIGSDTNKTIRAIAGEVLSEAMNLADDADTTINNLTEVLKWFKDLPEEEEGALNLIAKLGKPAVLYTAEDEEVIGGTKQVGDVKEASTGVYALIDALKTRVSNVEGRLTTAEGKITTAEGKITALETTVGDSTSGLVKSVADNTNEIGTLKTTVGDSTSGLVKDVNDLKTTVGDENSGLVKSVADINTTIEQNELTTATALTSLNTRVTALEAFDPWENYVAPTNSEPTPEP